MWKIRREKNQLCESNLKLLESPWSFLHLSPTQFYIPLSDGDDFIHLLFSSSHSTWLFFKFGREKLSYLYLVGTNRKAALAQHYFSISIFGMSFIVSPLPFTSVVFWGSPSEAAAAFRSSALVPASALARTDVGKGRQWRDITVQSVEESKGKVPFISFGLTQTLKCVYLWEKSTSIKRMRANFMWLLWLRQFPFGKRREDLLSEDYKV